MNTMIHQFFFRVATLMGWRWLVLCSGLVVLSASCSGKSDSKNTDSKEKPDSQMIKCYDPLPMPDSLSKDSGAAVPLK